MTGFSGDEMAPLKCWFTLQNEEGDGGKGRGMRCGAKGSVSMVGRSWSGARMQCKAGGGGVPCFGARGGRRGWLGQFWQKGRVGRLLPRKKKENMGGPAMDVGPNTQKEKVFFWNFWLLKWMNSKGNLNFEWKFLNFLKDRNLDIGQDFKSNKFELNV
jgi:hypothetical protein